MSLVRTFLANSGVLSMGPSQDSDRSLSKNIGAAVDGTGKPIQNVKMSDYYESVVDSDNVTQVIDILNWHTATFSYCYCTNGETRDYPLGKD